MPTSLRKERPTTRRLEEGPSEVDADVQAILDAFQDPASRCILQAVEENPRTVAELTEQCDLPRTTAYRKVDELVEASLLESRTRIRTHGHHAEQYAPVVTGLSVSFTDGRVDLSVARAVEVPAE